MSEPYVLGIGAANIDVHGKSRAPIVMRDSNPGRLRTSAGGVTRNVLENLARLGVRTRLVSAVGADLYGEMVLRQSAAAGIDISEVLTVPGEASSCYISVLDQKGDMLVAMSDMGILSHVTPELVRSLGERLRGAAAVVCDPCLPSETVAAVIREAGDTPVFLDPVSTSYARKVRPLAGGLFCLKPNRIELGVLADMETDSSEGIERACEALLSRGTRRVAVSLGEKGCYYADAEGRRLLRALHRRRRRLHGRTRLRLRARPQPRGEPQLRPRRRLSRRRERAHHKPRHVRGRRPGAAPGKWNFMQRLEPRVPTSPASM